MEHQDYLSVAEAAEKVRVHRTTVWQWIEDGRVPALKLGGVIRIPKKEWEQFLADSRIGDE